jgi:phosphoribosyl-dephospho-CoA transferase
MLNMARRQNNMYTLTHADGQTIKVVASNVNEVARAARVFKMDVVTIQREPSTRRSYKAKRV